MVKLTQNERETMWSALSDARILALTHTAQSISKRASREVVAELESGARKIGLPPLDASLSF